MVECRYLYTARGMGVEVVVGVLGRRLWLVDEKSPPCRAVGENAVGKSAVGESGLGNQVICTLLHHDGIGQGGCIRERNGTTDVPTEKAMEQNRRAALNNTNKDGYYFERQQLKISHA